MEGKIIKEIKDYNTRIYYKLWNNDSELFYREYRDKKYFFNGARIDKLLTESEYYKDILNRKFVYTDSLEDEDEKVKITLDIVGKWKERKDEKREQHFRRYGEIQKWEKNSFDYIPIYREFEKEEVKEYYRFDLKLEVRGLICTNFILDTRIRMFYYLGESGIDASVYDSVFGKRKRYIGSPEPLAEYYAFYTKDVDKVIGTKSYYTIDSIFEETFELGGKTEEFVLDMHSFDNDIYQLFKKHHLLEIEEIKDDPIVEDDDIVPTKTPWYKRLFGFQ